MGRSTLWQMLRVEAESGPRLLKMSAAHERLRESTHPIHVVGMHAQRMDQILIHTEFHEIETAESRGILVLLATVEPDIDSFDLIGKMRDLVFAQRQIEQFDECLEHRHHQCRR